MKEILLVILLLCSMVASATTKQVDVIYGKDNRKDIYETKSNLYLTLAKSAAGMIAKSSIKVEGQKADLTGQTLASQGICAKEKFAHQVASARCSGFLVGPDLLATAGHCITSDAECKNYAWVFDYAIASASQSKVTVPATSVYNCKKIIKTVQDSSSMNDFAVIQLDRVVTDREPLKFKKTDKPVIGTELVVIGCPTGLPLKVSDGAKVRTLKETYFTANLDTYGGNSGSAVFNAVTGEVEGILVRGETDYVRDPSGCMVSNVCADDGCRGEDVTYSNALADFINELSQRRNSGYTK